MEVKVERLGGKAEGVSFLFELVSSKGREKLKKYDIFSLIWYQNSSTLCI